MGGNAFMAGCILLPGCIIGAVLNLFSGELLDRRGAALPIRNDNTLLTDKI